MAERVRLRLQNAEEVIAKAKALLVLREQELQILRAKGQPTPPEVSLLGCWQSIEETEIIKNPLSNAKARTLGDFRTYFTAIGPEGFVGYYIKKGGKYLNTLEGDIDAPSHTWELAGKILLSGIIRYRGDPIQDDANFRPVMVPNRGMVFRRMRPFPIVTEARVENDMLIGKTWNDQYAYEKEFKAVRIEG